MTLTVESLAAKFAVVAIIKMIPASAVIGSVIWRFKTMPVVRPPDQQQWNVGNACCAFEKEVAQTSAELRRNAGALAQTPALLFNVPAALSLLLLYRPEFVPAADRIVPSGSELQRYCPDRPVARDTFRARSTRPVLR